LWKYVPDPICGSCNSFNAVHEVRTSKPVTVFPNPAGNSITVSFAISNTANFEVSMYDALGERVYFSTSEITETTDTDGNTKMNLGINTGNFSNGHYLLLVKTENTIAFVAAKVKIIFSLQL